jgi:hypothetical protein
MAKRRQALARRIAPVGVQASITPTTSGQYTTQAPAARVAGPMMSDRRKPKKKHKSGGGGIPGINKYLAGDTTYQDQISQLMKQREQFNRSNSSQQSMVNQDFGTALDKMLRQKDTDHKSMTGDFASRGLLNSGLFTKSVGDYDTNYQQQYNELATGQQRSLSDLLEALANYGTENDAATLAAKQDAIRRRAQKYGITT